MKVETKTVRTDTLTLEIQDHLDSPPRKLSALVNGYDKGPLSVAMPMAGTLPAEFIERVAAYLEKRRHEARDFRLVCHLHGYHDSYRGCPSCGKEFERAERRVADFVAGDGTPDDGVIS